MKVNVPDKGYILDVSVFQDYKAVATTELNIHIFQQGKNKEWLHKTTIRVDDPPVRVEFAPLKEKRLIAVAGWNCRVGIWLEELGGDKKPLWRRRTPIKEFSMPVRDISFCIFDCRLKLAVVGLDSKLRIFESSAESEYLDWNCFESFHINPFGGTCVHWNPDLYGPLTLLVGCEYPKKVEKTTVKAVKEGKKEGKKEEAIEKKEEEKGEEKEQIGLIYVYFFDHFKKKFELKLVINEGHTDSIQDIEWCNQYGKDHLLFASSGLDKRCIVWKINYEYEERVGDVDTRPVLSYEKVFVYEHTAPLYRLSWNKTGSLLAVSSEKDDFLVFRKVHGHEFIKWKKK